LINLVAKVVFDRGAITGEELRASIGDG